jgi:tRNA modification GTPase
LTDTICAVATPPGIGGIAVVRVSGPRTFAILDRVVRGFRPSRQRDHTVRLGRAVTEGGAELDEIIIAAFRAPRSYTGEDVAEVSCHGGDYIPGELVELLCRQGCRHAEPGEFSRRAVLNGRLSLSRAEATIDLINARTPEAHRAALARYNGSLARRTRALLDKLDEARAAAEHHLGLDDAETPGPRGQAQRMRTLLGRVEHLLVDARRSRFLHDGARVAIVGRTNVGKSTLFNRLVGDDRAVVAAAPGTTRDRVEAVVAFGSVPVMLTDTCGITTSTGGEIARQTAASTEIAIAAADLVLAVFDGSRPARMADRRVLNRLGGRPVVNVVNKTDAVQRFDANLLNGNPRVALSALTGANVGRLRRLLAGRFRPGRETAAANVRHCRALADCAGALRRSAASPDAAAALTELTIAREALATVDSPVNRPDILALVFDRFCVGK